MKVGGGGSPRMQDFDGGGARMQDFDFRVSFARPAPCCTLCVFWRRRAPVLECRISTGVLPSAWLVWLSAGCFVQTRSALTQPHKNEHRMVLKPLCEGGGGYFFHSGSTNSSCLRLVIRAIIPMSAMMYYIWACG